jgi:hypothetical protein
LYDYAFDNNKLGDDDFDDDDDLDSDESRCDGLLLSRGTR